MAKKKEVSEEVKRLLKQVYDDCMKEDRSVRERQIRQWRRLKLLWEGFQRVWYNEVAHDWRIWDQTQDDDSDQSYYDKPVNVFRAYLETLIAALSITVPPVKCYPDNADSPLDLSTAKAGDKISQLIYRHNDAPMLWLHSLFILCTEAPVFCYTYPKADKEYGTYEEKEYEEVPENHQITKCSVCGFQLDDQVVEQTEELAKNEQDEFMPDDADAPLQAEMNEGTDICPSCMQQMHPEMVQEQFTTTRLVGTTHQPKSRVCQEVYGGLYVKVGNYAKCQKDTPYLIFSREKDYSIVVEEHTNLADNEKLRKQLTDGPHGPYEYEMWGRLSPQYHGEYPTNVVTENKAWIRPAKFNILKEEEAKKLKKLFPNGVKVTIVNEEFADAENESLDDCWTISENPLSDYLYHDPLGQSLVSVQEITNDLISLVLQTIEHGIGQVFADTAVLNFKAYGQTSVVPGGIFPATAKSGKGIGEGFYELRTATLSSEVLPFYQNIQSMGQLVSGALPSLFGGSLENSETASEYSMSRAQALQRLQNIWKMLNAWWKNVNAKSITMYIKEMKDDERDVRKDDDGNFINVFIRKAELEGKIGKIELEANENLPLTWSQRKDIVEKLMLNGNPEIIKILQAPENIPLIHDALGLTDFYVPGEDDVTKQYDEIKQLLNSEPIANPMDPANPELPSVEVDPLLDNHAVEFEICRKWAISEVGRQTKLDNEPGYRNVLLHAKMHFMLMQQNAANQATDGKGATPNEKPNENPEAPINEESNVPVVH